MCGRFSLHAGPSKVALQFGLAQPPLIIARYNIAPGTPILAIHADSSGARHGRLLHWGLIPSWAHEPAIGNRLINARAESLAERPAFRDALRSRRCIVPADGFYEWMASGGHKQPYYVRARENELFGFAGLHEHWSGPHGLVDSCTIITTPANELVRPLHDRMPAIVPVADYAHWLDPDNPDPEGLIALLRPAPAGHMIAYPVGLAVNSTDNDGPGLIAADGLL